jgi:predicted kinase|tara:strand:+ start:490 stop:903 length:414 start_codon:yes stop_codon:yes gene_type:complete
MIYIVTGPPCSGKSTHVRNNAATNDIIIDMDKIALSVLPEGTLEFSYDDKVRSVAVAARKAAIKEAVFQMKGENRRSLWIIHTDPTRDQRASYRAINGRVIEINPGKEVCIERLKERPIEVQDVTRKVIDKYFLSRP